MRRMVLIANGGLGGTGCQPVGLGGSGGMGDPPMWVGWHGHPARVFGTRASRSCHSTPLERTVMS